MHTLNLLMYESIPAVRTPEGAGSARQLSARGRCYNPLPDFIPGHGGDGEYSFLGGGVWASQLVCPLSNNDFAPNGNIFGCASLDLWTARL